MASMSSKINGPRKLSLYAAIAQSIARTSGVPRHAGRFTVIVVSAIGSSHRHTMPPSSHVRGIVIHINEQKISIVTARAP
jgi:hypothetical protein